MKHALLKTALAGLALTAAFAGTAHANDAWPTKTVRWVVPFPPGGAMDVIARTLGDKLSQSLKQPVIIENRPGAGGTIGSNTVAKADPDGHTIMIVSIGHALNPNLYPRLPYDAAKDFEPVSLVAIVPNVLVVNSTVKANSVSELVAQAKANPGKLTYASAGNGTSIHMAGEMFNSIAGVDIMHVPYKGSGPAVTDLIGGQVNMMFDSITSAKPHIESGRLRPLAVTTAKRSATLPNVPTAAEAGLKGYEVSPWFAVFAPANTPKPVIDRLHGEIVKAMQMPDVKARFATIGAEPVGSSPEELRTYLRSETDRWAKLIKERNITAN
ncbi:MAG TPA: tripartite tricarboxylate transporter substrate binding protein [Noviherbaspirillum sp.]|nr:tripartite tricarboxylate transporter substrate binding protein [Noviherbaspirillum sp.]